MRTAKKLLLATALTVALGGVNSAKATELEINATAQGRAAIELTEAAIMSFGTIDYLAANSGTVTLATNDAVAGGTGVTFDTTPLAPGAGEITVAGDGASDVDIACDATATMGDGAGNTLNIVGIEVIAGADNTIGVATGAANACVDSTTTSETMDLATDDTILVGASLDLTASPLDTDGVYATGTGGTTITLAVTYQ
ncbi:MAG: hypothetical protein DI586_00160 [Micavibrio aeruginosavorus]|uniref:DUF4402 domain-containing protein n=1 Tax=Micavibrio aeruginosavorus TaxID=349221 RepID=A0A2W5FRF6_9BACT|nr:MAG: hypothetical protein DI586_00160 [Micavibrio aeruginosavorus]